MGGGGGGGCAIIMQVDDRYGQRGINNGCHDGFVAKGAAGVSGVLLCRRLKISGGSLHPDHQHGHLAPVRHDPGGGGLQHRAEKEMLLPCLKTITLRATLQAIMILGMLWAVHHFIGTNRVLDLAIVTYMSAPAPSVCRHSSKTRTPAPMYPPPTRCIALCP